MNLVVNACDAMPKGGQIVIKTGNIDLQNQHAGIHEPVAPGTYVTISVTDTGTGMDAETVSHVFEPFFTTKEKEKGTGLGLAIVYGIVKQSGGYVSVESEPGRGSTFTVYLPRTAETTEGPGQPAAATAAVQPKATEIILLVEDEPKLATVVSTVLKLAGYTVLQAATGEEALAIAQAYEGRIHLMLTDIVLRGAMDSTELAQNLRRVRPEMKVLFMSGYSDSLLGSSRQRNNYPLLQKPFTVAELKDKVREQLSGNSQTRM